jgi:hypothetical protein
MALQRNFNFLYFLSQPFGLAKLPTLGLRGERSRLVVG